ncbi:uncharacterized protein [Procambarus clarkii]|uniref:uncharacterized protein n=1 Tax=Procambarus clarkii TaxID=6728 RepID=UPI003742AE78
MVTEPSSAAVNNKDWCAIWSTIVVSGAVALIGLSFVVRSIGSVGLVLVFIGGFLTVVAVCAAVGKCTRQKNKDPPQSNNLDRPPSYRISWRRSFLRRYRSHASNNELTELTLVNNGTQANETTPQDRIALYTQPILINATQLSSLQTMSHTSLNMDNHNPTCPEDMFSPTLTTIGTTRHTVSLSNLLDPPSYDAALANMDEHSIRKLKSEIYLPSYSSTEPLK